MAQNWTRSNWYDQSFRAAAPPTGTPPPAPARKGPSPKKQRGLKVLGLIVFALLICVSLGYVMTDGFGLLAETEAEAPTPSADQRPGSRKGEREETPSDYREFFKEWVRGSESEQRKGSRLERVERAEFFDFTLSSSEGAEALPLQELYERCSPSVVGIRAEKKGNLGSYAWGTGIVVTQDGFILTNEHVIDDTDKATVVLSDGTEYPALLVGEDVQTDVALLKIDAAGLCPAEFGDSAELRVGDSVYAIGNPLSDQLTGTLTDGILSAIDRNVSVNGKQMTLLQTTAALNEGNSGGPLLNAYGQVIGITNMKMVNSYSSVTVEGIGFAIPSTTVKSVTDALLREGKVTGRPGLGITVTAVSEAVAEKYEIPRGLYVHSVLPQSDAAAQGLQAEDIITHADGQPVTEIQDLLDIRDALSVGDRLRLSVWREGETLEITFRVMDQNELQ